MGATIDSKSKIQELEDEIEHLKFLLTKERAFKADIKNELLEVYNELNTVGILHGANSKVRAKNKLEELMQNNYGNNWKD